SLSASATIHGKQPSTASNHPRQATIHGKQPSTASNHPRQATTSISVGCMHRVDVSTPSQYLNRISPRRDHEITTAANHAAAVEMLYNRDVPQRRCIDDLLIGS